MRPRCGRSWTGLFCVALALAARPLPGQTSRDWKPVNPAEMALKQPVVDKDADAEALFWEVRVQDELASGYGQAVREHYVRIKVFTERGKASQGNVEIVFGPDVTVTDVGGRTIKPDGTILTL